MQHQHPNQRFSSFFIKDILLECKKPASLLHEPDPTGPLGRTPGLGLTDRWGMGGAFTPYPARAALGHYLNRHKDPGPMLLPATGGKCLIDSHKITLGSSDFILILRETARKLRFRI